MYIHPSLSGHKFQEAKLYGVNIINEAIIFCIPSSFLFLPLGASCILPICFELAFRRPFLFLYIKFSVHLPITINEAIRTNDETKPV